MESCAQLKEEFLGWARDGVQLESECRAVVVVVGGGGGAGGGGGGSGACRSSWKNNGSLLVDLFC